MPYEIPRGDGGEERMPRMEVLGDDEEEKD